MNLSRGYGDLWNPLLADTTFEAYCGFVFLGMWAFKSYRWALRSTEDFGLSNYLPKCHHTRMMGLLLVDIISLPGPPSC